MHRSPAFLKCSTSELPSSSAAVENNMAKSQERSNREAKNRRLLCLCRQPQARHLLLCRVALPRGNPPNFPNRGGFNKLDHSLKAQCSARRGHFSRRREPVH